MGVKSLWTLLEPVGRPVPLETMEGKSMAIDSSIWIYQFQATMRDKEGRGLVNAHVVGFLRRICKLLFYGIKPVFVFDGGAPALKRSTIAERKNKKAGAAASHAKVAERLLAAQMRREAVNQIQAQVSKGKGKGKALASPDDVVYMEDLDPTVPKTPARRSRADEQTSPQSSGKKRWRDHDPYRLPDVDMNAMVAQATLSNLPDPRLATEDELRAFIEEMKPEDLDVTSPAFRELPTEVQYEIIGDLRLKSRQTSYKRLQNMLRHAKTPMEFSKEQIKNLKQRNSLTQQLLTTTDSIGKAHVEIPIRIASERNRQYLLIKNEGEAGGWVLGIRDEGTRAKPIEIDQDLVEPVPKPVVHEDDEDEGDAEMEEVEIAAPSYDPDMREYRRSMALSALANRYSPKKLAPLTTKKVNRKPNSKPLFDLGQNDPEVAATLDDEDRELLAAMQRSLEDVEESEMQMAIEASTTDLRHRSSTVVSPQMEASSSLSTLPASPPDTTPRKDTQTLPIGLDSDSDDDLYASPTRLETALSIANTGPSNTRQPSNPQRSFSSPQSHPFGLPNLLVSPSQSPKSSVKPFPGPNMEKVSPLRARTLSSLVIQEAGPPVPTLASIASPMPAADEDVGDDDDMEEVVALPSLPEPSAHTERPLSPVFVGQDAFDLGTADISIAPPVNTENDAAPPSLLATNASARTLISPPPAPFPPEAGTSPVADSDSDSDEHSTRWSRSPSPALRVSAQTGDSPSRSSHKQDSWDAAQEMDAQAEEGEYARFMSQVRGKDLDTVRKEIDEEILNLNQERKAAMRDSDDITQQMVSQIMMMLRLFGIPYITAPMEAEAQCAELFNLELVDGIITDDSDVFLFGGGRVFKNMFNQSKTVECFLSTDLERELGLERDRLIRLAYLLGSDYTDGLPGVGPVVAMELLTEFGGHDALHKFKDWWRRVQSGRDGTTESGSVFRKRFKKRFKELFLPEEWPNPAVRDAYYHPTVDHSEEPFKWGLPDLDALREFFHSELGWNQSKVDDLLLPIVQKMNKRTQQGAMNRQGNLLGFLDVPSGGAVVRKRQAYSSKRLQQVVADFRKKQVANTSGSSNVSRAGSSPGESGSDDEEHEGRPKKRKKTAVDDKSSSTSARGPAKRGARGGRGSKGSRGARGRGGPRATASKPTKGQKAGTSDSEDTFGESVPSGTPPPPLNVALRPRPKPRPVARPIAAEEAVQDER